MIKYCSSCKNGTGFADEARYKVQYIDDSGHRKHPVTAWLCKNHYEMICNDFDDVKILVDLNKYNSNTENIAIATRADYLTRKHTAFDSFDELIKNNPTLNPDGYDDLTSKTEIQDLRMYYYKAINKQAFK